MFTMLTFTLDSYLTPFANPGKPGKMILPSSKTQEHVR